MTETQKRHVHKLEQPLQLPPCACSDPDCAKVRGLANRLLLILHAETQDAYTQGVAATMVLSRILIEAKMSPRDAASLVVENMYLLLTTMLTMNASPSPTNTV